LVIVSSAAVNMGVQVSLLYADLDSSDIPESVTVLFTVLVCFLFCFQFRINIQAMKQNLAGIEAMMKKGTSHVIMLSSGSHAGRNCTLKCRLWGDSKMVARGRKQKASLL
jgi:hypothetical protein